MESTNSIITFSWPFEDLFEDIKALNQIRVKELKNKDGKSEFENYSITGDEEEAIKVLLENATHELVELCIKQSSGITDGVIINESVGGKDSYGCRINDHEAYNPNSLKNVDNGFKQLLYASVLMQWYEVKGLQSEFALWAAKLENIKKTGIISRFFQLGMRKLD